MHKILNVYLEHQLVGSLAQDEHGLITWRSHASATG